VEQQSGAAQRVLLSAVIVAAGILFALENLPDPG